MDEFFIVIFVEFIIFNLLSLFFSVVKCLYEWFLIGGVVFLKSVRIFMLYLVLNNNY